MGVGEGTTQSVRILDAWHMGNSKEGGQCREKQR